MKHPRTLRNTAAVLAVGSLVCLFTLSCVAGCDLAGDAPDGPDPDPPPGAAVAPDGGEDGELETLSAPFIIGRVDWRDTTRLGTNNPARQVARAVGLLQLPAAGVRCTGFLVAPDVLMTNHHCVATEDEARDAVAVFNYEAGTPLDGLELVACDGFLGADDRLDVALLRCRTAEGTPPGDRYGVVTLSAEVPATGAKVYMIHQNCDYMKKPSCDYTKKYSPGAVMGLSGRRLHHSADGLGGSSGAPLFDRETHRVVGLHHAGYGDPETGRGVRNEALLMREVLAVLRADFPDVLGALPPPEEGSPETPADGRDPARPPDERDPAPGARIHPVSWESAHPYGNEAGFEQTFQVPGATRVRAHFARIDTEDEYDLVLVRGAAGAAGPAGAAGAGPTERYSGALGEVTTGWFEGDTLTVRFESDESIQAWGFLLDAIDWVP